MKRLLSLLLALYCSGVSFAAEKFASERYDTTFSPVAISGKVLDKTSQPLAGATVMIKNHAYLSTVTDAGGNFSIAGKKIDTIITVGIVRHGVPGSSSVGGIWLEGNRVLIPASSAGSVKLDLFTVAGARVVSLYFNKLGDAAHTATLPMMAEGLYVLRVSANNEVAAFKRIFSARQELAIEKGSRKSSGVVTAAAAAVSDSLVVVAANYLPAYLPITSYSSSGAQLQVVTAINQWQPATGELEHVGGMVKIKANGYSFAMGQPAIIRDDDSKWNLEQPVHVVSFNYDYWMDTTEVTQKMYDSLMKTVPNYAMTANWNSKYGAGDKIAAHHMQLGDVVLFCNARSKAQSLDTVYTYDSITGTPGQMSAVYNLRANCARNGYRLPTETEWEYACRGGTISDFYWNKMYRPYPATSADTAEISMYALWYGNSGKIANDKPEFGVKPGVASKLPNKYGLYDMAGSLLEWSHYVVMSYPSEASVASKPDSTKASLEKSIYARGGNFSNDPVYLRSANRIPAYGDYPYCFYGFRTVREVR